MICRLEDADYQVRSLTMLQRIAAALGHRVEVTFVPVNPKPAMKRPAKESRPADAKGAKERL